MNEAVIYRAQTIVDNAKTALDDASDALATIDLGDVFDSGAAEARDATEYAGVQLVAVLSELLPVLRELRDIGIDITAAPAEDEALLTVIANGPALLREMRAEVAHLESVMARFGAGQKDPSTGMPS